MEDEENAATKVTELESLPMELRTDIFSRVDSKTLARFRCVSKPMASFVSTPELISAHGLRSRKNPLLLFFVESDESYSYRLVSLDTTTMTSSNISLQNREFSFPFLVPLLTCLELVCVHDKYENGIYVFNPTNNCMKALPPSDLHHHPPDSNPCPPDGYQTLSVGFGYVRSTNKYKVLRISKSSTFTADRDYDEGVHFSGTFCNYIFTEVFTVGVDEKWRDIRQATPAFLGRIPAVVNESLYYLREDNLVTIYKFDLEKEEWFISPPLPFTLESRNLLLKELGGDLCLVTQTKPDSHLIDIWILKDFDTFSWAKVYHMDVSSLVDYIYSGIVAYPLNIEEDGRLLLFLRFPMTKLVYYDPKKGDFEDTNLRENLLSGCNENWDWDSEDISSWEKFSLECSEYKHFEEINLTEKLSLGCNDRVSAPPTFYVDSYLSFDD